MEKVISAANELAAAITNSACYIEYKKYKEIIASDKELSDKVSYFRKTQLEYQAKLIENKGVSFEEEKHISKMYFDIILNDNAKIFIECEKQMLDLVCMVQDVIFNDF